MKLTCLIVDDEPIARKGLEEYVQEIEFLHLAGVCETAMKASFYLKEHAIDLLYLDIQMPKVSGIDFLKTLNDPPLAIITTAYTDYALEGYALDVVDYIVKPVTFERFLKASQKAYEYHRLKHKTNNLRDPDEDHFFVKCDNKFEKLFFRDIAYIEALQNYVVIHLEDRKLITYLTLSGLESQLPAEQFIKVHKSYIVSIPRIKAIDGNDILTGHARIPISRYMKDEVLQKIMGKRLFKR